MNADAGRRSADLDRLHDQLLREGVDAGLDQLFRYLSSRRLAEGSVAWQRWIEQVALRHPLRDLVHGDPYAARAFARPRGYPGDPATLDHVYGSAIADLRDLHPAPAFLGHPVHRYVTTRRPSSLALADRCRAAAAAIDAAAAKRAGARVLCLAAGHLREARLSTAVRNGGVAELVAVDYDPEAVRTIAAGTVGLPVRSVHASLRDLLRWRLRLGSFDLVYSLTLFDHLADRTARLLLDCLLGLLRPGGRIVVANFLPDHPDQAFLECYMAWNMVCRTTAALERLAGNVLPSGHRLRAWCEPQLATARLEITHGG